MPVCVSWRLISKSQVTWHDFECRNTFIIVDLRVITPIDCATFYVHTLLVAKS